ncbi:MAG TPA: DUF4395 domain-containing protein [Acidimicrobiales bacterium]|nr:MAG: hypothetical protein B7Z69_03960 [Actinobacteria bacterium 21-73-9]HQU25893.1 DUF4395 domain-containing protein [Acidimicrobiales bacterium]
MKRLPAFPDPVNEAAARTVALGVVTMSVLALLTGWAWLLGVLLYGFAARVLAGPTLSPLGQFATRVAAPRLTRWTRYSPGPPKRFAQGMGLAVTIAATLTWLYAGWSAARWLLLPLVGAASLEAFAGFCVGCAMFRGLMRVGVVPASVCAACADLSEHYRRLEAVAD